MSTSHRMYVNTISYYLLQCISFKYRSSGQLVQLDGYCSTPTQPPRDSQSSDMTEIMSVLPEQKAENNPRNHNVLELQKTVNYLLAASLTLQTTSSPTLSQSFPPTYLPSISQFSLTYSTPVTLSTTVHSMHPSIPTGVANAASMLQNNFARQYGDHSVKKKVTPLDLCWVRVSILTHQPQLATLLPCRHGRSYGLQKRQPSSGDH